VIIRVHHVGMVVRKIEEAKTFWRDILGLAVTHEAEVPEQAVRAALLACGPCEIELIEPTREDTGVARFLAARGEGLHHVCFESDDVAREMKRFWATGVQMIDAQPRRGLAGMVGFVHPRSCAGVLVELATPPAPATPPAAPLAVAAVHALVEDLAGATRLFRDLFGLTLTAQHPDGAFVHLAAGGVTLQFGKAARSGAAPGLSVVRLQAADPAALARRLERGRVPFRRWSGGLAVDPLHARGVPLIIQ
jgi:methylmalonyl-CoA/ethylmalonyl-CoA epimerase